MLFALLRERVIIGLQKYWDSRSRQQFENWIALSSNPTRGITIQPEERKPPVTSEEVSLSKDGLEILSENPKYAVRAMMSKERFMVELEKGMCKKQYSDIGKEVVDGVTIDEEPLDDEDQRVMDYMFHLFIE